MTYEYDVDDVSTVSEASLERKGSMYKTASNYAVLHNPTLVRCNYNFHNHIIIIQSVKPIAITLFKQSEELSDR